MRFQGDQEVTHFQKSADGVLACSVHCADTCANGVKAAVCKANLPMPRHTWGQLPKCVLESFCNLLPCNLSKQTESQQHVGLPWWSGG